MSVADYILAGLGLLIFVCLGGLFWLLGMSTYFAPTPTAEHVSDSRKGCVGFVLCVLAVAYFVGVLLNGDWGWP